jgi:hypothetical protein
MDPHHFGKLDPDLDSHPHQSGKLDPDLHQSKKVEALESFWSNTAQYR